MTFVMIVHLNKAEVLALRKPVRGQGGLQNLQRYWRTRLQSNLVVLSDPKWIERSMRYISQYGDGGFQGRMGRNDVSP